MTWRNQRWSWPVCRQSGDYRRRTAAASSSDHAIITCLALVARLATAQDQSGGGLPETSSASRPAGQRPAAAAARKHQTRPGAEKAPARGRGQAGKAAAQGRTRETGRGRAPAHRARQTQPQPPPQTRREGQAPPAEPAPVKGAGEKAAGEEAAGNAGQGSVKKPASCRRKPRPPSRRRKGAPMPTRAQKPPKPARTQGRGLYETRGQTTTARHPNRRQNLREKLPPNQPATRKPVKPERQRQNRPPPMTEKPLGRTRRNRPTPLIGAKPPCVKARRRSRPATLKPVKWETAPEQAAANDGKNRWTGRCRNRLALIGADAAREKLAAGKPASNPQNSAKPPAGTRANSTRDKLQRRQARQIPAPEAKVKPNDVAIRAAEQATSPKAAALGSGRKARRGQRSMTSRSPQNARSSAEGFRHLPVTQGLQTGKSGKSEKAGAQDDGNDQVATSPRYCWRRLPRLRRSTDAVERRRVALNTGRSRGRHPCQPGGQPGISRTTTRCFTVSARTAQTRAFDDGSARTTVLRADGSRVVTIRDADMNVHAAARWSAPMAARCQLIDDTITAAGPRPDLPAPPPVEVIRRLLDRGCTPRRAAAQCAVDRRFTLSDPRHPEVRALVAPVNVPEVTFDTGSAAITPIRRSNWRRWARSSTTASSANPNETL